MAFLVAAKRKITTLQKSDPLRITLEYLVKNAVGWKNARPQSEIVEHLARKGKRMSINKFQQTILKQTRESDVFIASSQNGCFLIGNQSDAEVMRDFYENRIQAEQRHVNHLKSLASVMSL